MENYLYTGTTTLNWSVGANWTNMSTGTTGTVPTSADNAYLNNKTITLVSTDTINVNKISSRATTGFSTNAVAGGSVSIVLTNSFYPTITVGAGGLEPTIATTSAHMLTVSGSSTTGTTSKFLIDCSGLILGGFSSSSSAILFNCSNTKIQVNCSSVTGGITSTQAYAIINNGVGNTIYINCSGAITGNIGSAIATQVLTGSIYYKATSIEGGSSIPAVFYSGNNTSTQYFGYSYDFSTGTPAVSNITNLNASSTYSAIAGGTTPFLINATNVNSNTNGLFPIYSLNFKLNSTATVKIPDLSATLQSFVVGGTSTSTAAEFWAYLTSNATTAGSLGKLIVDNLNATVLSRATQTSLDTVAGYIDTEVAAIKTATDRIPTNPASVQSTGDQIATLQ